MHNTTTDDHLVPRGREINNEYDIDIDIYYVYYTLCTIIVIMTETTRPNLNHLISAILFDNHAHLALAICRNVLQPLNLVVADRFDRLRLLDDVHKSESKKKEKRSVQVDKKFDILDLYNLEMSNA